MKENEALKILKPYIDENCMEYADEIYLGYDYNFEAFTIAIQALEKQVPKKIVRIKLRPSEYGSEYRCPICESDLIPTEFFNEDGTEPDEKIAWCSGCGQKLDWSE